MLSSHKVLILFFVLSILTIVAWCTPTEELCTNLNEKTADFIKCYFSNVKLIKIATILKGNVREPASSDFLNVLYLSVVKVLGTSIELQTFCFDFEEATYDITELYSWSGLRFIERETQLNKSLMTFEGQQATKNTNRNARNFGVIIVVDTVSNLDSYLTGSVRPPFHTPNVPYLIIILKNGNKTNLDQLIGLLERCWKDYGILSAVALIGCHQERVIYYEPFTISELNGTTGIPRSWGVIRNKSIDSRKLCEISHGIVPTSFNGYPIRSVFFLRAPTAISWNSLPLSFLKSQAADARLYSKELGGYDGMTFGNLLKVLNLTSNSARLSNNGGYLFRENGTFSGSGIILISEADIGINPHLMIDRGGGDVEFSAPLFFDSICIIAPKSCRIPPYLTLIVSFTYSLWIFLLAFFVIAGIIWKMIQKFSTFKVKTPSQDIYVLTIMMILLIYSTPLKLRPSGTSERIFLSACLFLGIVLTGIVSGFLSMSMTTAIYYKDINTLQELEEANLKVFTMSSAIFDLISGNDLPSKYVALRNNLKIVKNDSLDSVVKYNVGVVKLSQDFNILKEHYKFTYNEERLHLIPECLGMFYASLIVRKGWPLVTHFNRAIKRFQESGLLLHWYQSTKRALNTKIILDNYNELRRLNHAPLTLSNLRLAFGLLAIGYTAAFILLLFERWGSRTINVS